MNHYFTDNPNLKQNRREITFRFLDIDYTLWSDDGVFSKDTLDQGTSILLNTIHKMQVSGSVCDLGCGIGVVGVLLHQFFDVEMCGFDVNPRAVALANDNYKRYGVRGKNVIHDGIAGHFDWIISNPPIRVGKEILYRLFEEAYASLNLGGSFVFVIRKQHGAKSAASKCIELFGNCELLVKSKGYYVYKSIKIDNT